MIYTITPTHTARRSARALPALLPGFALALVASGCGERFQLGEVNQGLDQPGTESASLSAPIIADGPEDADARLDAENSGPGLGDIDGDGYDDWWAFPHIAYGGPRRNGSVLTVPEDVGPRFALYDGDEPIDLQIDPVGDIDGDGFADLAFSTSASIYHEYAWDEGEPPEDIAASEATIARRWATQRAYLWYGGPDRTATVLALRDAAVSFGGRDDLVSRFQAELGERQHPDDARFEAVQSTRLMRLGDINGDGFGDLAVTTSFAWMSSREEQRADAIWGIQTAERNESVTYVYYGGAQRFELGAVPEPAARLTGLGLLTSAGDLNGDGFGDVQALRKSGLRFLRGGAKRLSGDVDFDAVSVGTTGSMPSGVTALGDMDKDGFDDFAALWTSDTTAGNLARYALVYGSATLLDALVDETAVSAVVTVPGPVSYITSAGDWTGDGRNDLLLGVGRSLSTDLAEGYRWNGIEVRLLPGTAARYSGQHEISVYRPGLDPDAPSVSGGGLVGDIDGDGFDDLFLRSLEGSTSRAAYVKYGRPLSSSPDIR